MPFRRRRRSFASTFPAACALAIFVVGVLSAAAQAVHSATEYPDSRVDVYGGYGYFHPISSGIAGHQFFDVYNPNATVSVTGWFNRYIGIATEGSYFSGNSEHRVYDPVCTSTNCDQLLYSGEAGPILRYPLGSFVPFIHALGGGVRMNGPVTQPLTWGWGVTGGIGLDYMLPFFSKKIGVRVFQADYQYSQVVYGPLYQPAGIQGGFNEIDALKVSSGLLLRLGNIQPKRPVQLACAAEPNLVHPGEPVEVVGSSVDLDPHKKADYVWQTTGGKLTPHGNHAAVDTTGLAPGDYTVTGLVSEGLKARQQARCAAVFTLKPFDPPSITCSADPSSATSGTAVTITAAGASPQNRPLTYAFETSAGILNAAANNGNTAKLITDGLSPTTINVTCHATDDLNQTASAITQVTLTAPVVPVVSETQNLCAISFERDRRRPVRVDNEAKACLDGIALTLTQQTEAKLVMIGNTSADEKPEAAAERALNAREYLTTERGIDPARVELRLGETSGRNVRDILVPSGAIFNQPNTQPFDEGQVTRHGQPYGKHGAAGRSPHSRRPAARSKTSRATIPSAPLPPATQAQAGPRGKPSPAMPAGPAALPATPPTH